MRSETSSSACGDGDGLAGHVGDQARGAIHFAEGDIERAAHIADGGARAERAKGDDGGDAVRAVAFGGVGDQLFAPVVGIVQVDVGHGDAVGIEEALEQQAVLEGIDAGDAQRVGDHAARAGAAHVPPDVALFRRLAQIPHDEEIVVEAHGVDDAQLVFQTLHDLRLLRARRAVAPDKTGIAKLAQKRLGVAFSFRHRECGQVIRGRELQFDVALLGDFDGVFQRFGQIGVEPRHLFRRAHVVRRVGHPHAIRLVDRFARADAEQDVVRVGLVALGVVDVVGGDQRDVHLVSQVHHLAVDGVEFGDVVALQFEVVPVGELRLVPAHGLAGFVDLPVDQQLRDFALRARREHDQPLAVLREHFFVDAGLVVEAFQLGDADEFEQILVAGLVLRQQDDVIRLFIVIAVVPRILRDVGFHADDGLDLRGFAGLVEIDHAKHRSVIGNRQRGHAQFRRVRRQSLHTAQSVQQ